MTYRFGSLVLQPIALLALALLLMNDWWLKPQFGASVGWPPFVVGKLSDAAGLVLGPLVVATWCTAWRARWSPPRLAALSCGAIVVPFVLAKTVPAVASWFERGFALAYRARIVCDPTDLLTLPFALVPAWLILRHRR